MEKILQGINEGTLNVKQFMTIDDVSHVDLFSEEKRKCTLMQVIKSQICHKKK